MSGGFAATKCDVSIDRLRDWGKFGRNQVQWLWLHVATKGYKLF